MGFRTMRQCVETLQREGLLVAVDHAVDPHLEIAEIQRRLFRSGGPAVLFRNARGCSLRYWSTCTAPSSGWSEFLPTPLSGSAGWWS